MNEQLSYVDYVCLQVNDALKCIPALYLEHENVRRIMRIAPEEEHWIREMWSREHHRTNPVYGRLDAVCDFSAAQWQDTLHFMAAEHFGRSAASTQVGIVPSAWYDVLHADVWRRARVEFRRRGRCS